MKLFNHVLRSSLLIRKILISNRSKYLNLNFFSTSNTSFNMKYCVVQKENENGYISPFHDIPLYANEAEGIVNMVVEIPRWSNAKMEITKSDPLNPIKQDVKNGKLRFVANCFPHHGYIGTTTWENPEIADEHTNMKGDNDPMDVMEIGQRIAKRGEIMQVKVLGCIALIDEGRLIGKFLRLTSRIRSLKTLKDITDVEKYCPGLLKASVEWLRTYKIPDGKPENTFAFGGEFKDRAFALEILKQMHKEWESLMSKDEDKINLTNTTLGDAKTSLGRNEAEQIVNSNPNFAEGPPVEDIVGKWHFLHLK